jgi:uncharacterized protein YqgC (DUF456 family)
MSATLALILILLGLALSIAGFIGAVLPVIPGPPLGFIALLLLSWAKGWEPFSALFLIVMGCLTLLVLVLDYIVPAIGAKKYGASRFSVFCSVVGMILGLFVFPPFGLFIGGFLGAMAGELYVGRGGKEAMRAGWGVLIGNLFGIGLKMAFCGVMLFFYIRALF